MKIIIGIIILLAFTCNQSKDLTQEEKDTNVNETTEVLVESEENIETETEQIIIDKRPEEVLAGKRAEIVGQWKLELISIVGRQRTEIIPEKTTYIMFSGEGDYIDMEKKDATTHPKYIIHDQLMGRPTLNISIGETGSPGILTIENDTMIIDHGYYDGERYTYSRVKPK